MSLVDKRHYGETKNMKAISIIITTIKDKILTLESLEHCPVSYEVVLSKKHGLGFARNWGAEQAKNDLFVFLDDDLRLRDEIWQEIMNTQKGEFKMTFDKGFPISRVMAIHKEDFWRVGGFDRQIRFTGEDRDFYVRAVMKGMRFKKIPINLTIHQPHLRRSKNIHVAIRATSENVQFVHKYAGRFPEVLRIDFFDRLRRGQIRTLLIQVLLFYYYLLKWH